MRWNWGLSKAMSLATPSRRDVAFVARHGRISRLSLFLMYSSFPGHIACSSKPRSEMVVPVFKGDNVIAVIDVDSKGYSAFDDIDKDGLEKIAKLISPLFE